ncbi:cytochrome b5 [Polychaeton citri CBS 116435]|uniref:Cytochrome b5 n=1 Tax=Polychaeton citri CBS 116435 TaxID=1314669 RepID=A0A9P4Q4Q3_9PEZI|nr:cytochrome b5 [Polychaeton citri CBS 116435]
MSKTFTLSDVSEHTSKKDLFIVIHDKVYNATSFVDEHPGGEEVLLDVGGQDATEAFEDVGHSDEARDVLNGLCVGNVEKKEGDDGPTRVTSGGATTTTNKPPRSAGDGGLSIGYYALILLGGTLAYVAFQFLADNTVKKL